MKVHVKHILVDHKYEIEDIKKLLDKGMSFENLARKYSKCSSAQSGGDLGVVDVNRFDESFGEAVLLLKAGQISPQPVRTKFGYHLIQRLK